MYLPSKRWRGNSVVGPMGSRTGLGDVWDDLGAKIGITAIDPRVASYTPGSYDAAIAAANYGIRSAASDAVSGPGAQSVTGWLNQNAGKVAIGAAAFFTLMMFARAGR